MKEIDKTSIMSQLSLECIHTTMGKKESSILSNNNYTYKKVFKFFLRFLHNIKLHHWNTFSHARHEALDTLHKEVSALSDSFLEIYISHYKRPIEVLKIVDGLNIKFRNMTEKSFLEYLDTSFSYLDGMKHTVLSKHPDLMNILDDILSAITQTKYRFTLE